MSESFNLDRENNIKENVDATGRQWKIHFMRQTGLCYVRPNPDRDDAVIPKELQGKWTKPSTVEPLIKKHVIATWDKADKVKADNERKAQVAKEHAARKAKEEKEEAARKKVASKKAPTKKVKAESDKGSTTD